MESGISGQFTIPILISEVVDMSQAIILNLLSIQELCF